MKTVTVTVNDATITAYRDETTGFYVVGAVGACIEGYSLREAPNLQDTVTRNYATSDEALSTLESWVKELIVS